MTNEQSLIYKQYYKTVLQETDVPELQQLGQLHLHYRNEPEEASIRFAQGELYYHFQDYESAIFKWEKVKGDLQPWAQKNIGDAYIQLQQWEQAEAVYTSIYAHSVPLKVEIAFQLFHLYKTTNNAEAALKVIDKALALAPDYGNVTEIAKSFYEEQGKWERAVQLTLNELVRTEQEYWVQVLIQYTESGYTVSWKPAAFSSAMMAAYRSNAELFRQLLLTLWESCREQNNYLYWQHMIQDILQKEELRACENWDSVLPAFQQTFPVLLSGRYSSQALRNLMPVYLENWLRMSRSPQAAAAVVAWGQLFPFTLSPALTDRAQTLLQQVHSPFVQWETVSHILEHILNWGDQHGFFANEALRWRIHYFQQQQAHLLIVGSNDRVGPLFVNEVLDYRLPELAESAIPILCSEHEHTSLKRIDEAAVNLMNPTEQIPAGGHGEAVLELQLPSRFLQQQDLSLIGAPPQWPYSAARPSYFDLADAVALVVDTSQAWTAQQIARVKEVCQHAKGVPLCIVLHEDTPSSPEERRSWKRQIQESLHMVGPDAQVMIADEYDVKGQLLEIMQLLQTPRARQQVLQVRTANLLTWTRKVMYALAEQRRQREQQLAAQIQQEGELVLHTQHMAEQLTAFERTQIQTIASSLQDIREAVKRDIERHLPAQLQACGEMVTPDSDFRTIHMELNSMMNERIRVYTMQTAAGKLQLLLQNWIEERRQSIYEQFATLAPARACIRNAYHVDCLEPYTHIFTEWEQLAARIPYDIQIDEMNILLRTTPGQFLLKSAGKLLGGRQGNVLLYHQYKKYVQHEQYEEIIAQVTEQMLRPFEAFAERAEQQLVQYFREPIGMLKRMTEDMHVRLQESRNEQSGMKDVNVYEDPLLFLDVQLRQCELLSTAVQRVLL